MGVIRRCLGVCCTQSTISFTGSPTNFPEEAATSLVRTFTEQVEQIVGSLGERSVGMSMVELARERSCDDSLVGPELLLYISSLMGAPGN